MRPFVVAATLLVSGLAAFAQAQAGGPGTVLYHDAAFTIAYPRDWTLDRNYTYDLGSPPIPGVAFTISATLTSGTNLSSDSKLSVEHMLGACSAARFLDDAQDEKSVTDAGRDWSVATAGDAAAGNRYEQTVYAIAHGKDCYGVRYFIHYAAIENFDPGSVKEFDRKALMAAFDSIRRSLSFTN
ncbi:MAG TPA: hypothetical protein VMH86_12600 [Rhizomicrobium sp.]|nr:hypothetical protein [Rhizomicrobium sp.]